MRAGDQRRGGEEERRRGGEEERRRGGEEERRRGGEEERRRGINRNGGDVVVGNVSSGNLT